MNKLIIDKPIQLTNILSIAYFELLIDKQHQTFTSDIESSELFKEYKCYTQLQRTDFHKGMKYQLTEVDCRQENCIQYEYLAEYKNGSGFTSGVGFILKDERDNNKDNFNHNWLELLRVRSALVLIGVIEDYSVWNDFMQDPYINPKETLPSNYGGK